MKLKTKTREYTAESYLDEIADLLAVAIVDAQRDDLQMIFSDPDETHVLALQKDDEMLIFEGFTTFNGICSKDANNHVITMLKEAVYDG